MGLCYGDSEAYSRAWGKEVWQIEASRGGIVSIVSWIQARLLIKRLFIKGVILWRKIDA
jgi:hypothetical protein